MKQQVRALLFSAFVLPGLGQVINRQILKGLALMGAITIVFFAAVLKFLFDLAAVMNEVVDTNMDLGPDQYGLIIQGLRARGPNMYLILLAVAFCIWLYSLVDAYLCGRRLPPPAE